jgi:hypothetical protein
MSDSLISRAMREIAKRRMEKLSADQRQKIAGKGGKAWWDSLTQEERQKAIERIQKARREKRAQQAKARAEQQKESSAASRAKPKRRRGGTGIP